MSGSEKVYTQYISGAASITFRIILFSDNPRFQNASGHRMPVMPVIGHRGSGSNKEVYRFLENSINSYRYALCAGASGVEMDVRLSKDDVVVINHDDEVPDCEDTNITHAIINMTAQEFRQNGKCTAWGVKRVTLADFYEEVPLFEFLDIDVKYWFDIFDNRDRLHFVTRILNDVDELGEGKRAFFSTFNVVIAAMLGLSQRKYPVTMLVGNYGEDIGVFAARVSDFLRFGSYFGLAGLVADSTSVLAFPRLSRKVVARGWKLFSWGERNLDSPGIERQLKLGVSGFVTDYVGVTLGLLDNALTKGKDRMVV
jgi:glycerophosphoryl diester phosphodiesterase